MKTLLLVRHAKSDWKAGAGGDFARPLNERGRRDAPEMGRRLVADGLVPGLVVASPAARARNTAEAMAAEFGGAGTLVLEDRLYLAPPGAIMEVVRGLDDGVDRAMLVGHNPGMTQIVNSFAGGGIENVPTCGVVVIRRDVSSWSALDADGGGLDVFDFPKKRR